MSAMLPGMMERRPERRQARKEKPAACPFCEERVPRPKPFGESEEPTGGA